MRYLSPANGLLKLLAILGLIYFTAVPAPAAVGDDVEKPPVQLVPASSVAYFEASEPKDVISLLLDSPISKLIQRTPDYRKGIESPQYKDFLAVIGQVEDRAGVKWRPALESITGEGVVLSVDAATQGAVLLVRSKDVKTRDSVRDAIISVVRERAKADGRPDPIQSKDYRGLGAYNAGDVWITAMGRYLLISNKPEEARAVADLFLDGGRSMSDESVYTDARKLAVAHGNIRQAAWGFVRLDKLRQMGVAKQLLGPKADGDAKSDNVPVELLAGGVMSVLRNSPFIATSLELSDPGNSDSRIARISFVMPSDPTWIPAEERFFFAPGGGGADEPLRPKDTVLSISIWRDLSALYQAAPDLFNEGIAGQFAQADSGLSNFLGGKSFGHDILGALDPQIQFVAARQDYKAQGAPTPSIQLPAMALVFKVKDGKAKLISRPSHLAFQTLLAFGNLGLASKGLPTLESKSETRGNATILYASSQSADADDENAAKTSGQTDANGKGADGKSDMAKPKRDILDNFSPAMVLSPDHLMICSTRTIAEELVDLTQRKAGPSAQLDANNNEHNIRIEANGSIVAALLRENREQLIAQNMLQKGHDRPAAERDIDLLINLVDCVKNAHIHLDQTDKSVRLELEATSTVH